MVLTDPRAIFGYAGYFDSGSAENKVIGANLLDHDGNPMSYEADYAHQLLDLYNLFTQKNIDIVFVIGQISYPQINFHQAVYEVAIQPCAIDKHNDDGSIRIRATEALWNAEQEIIRVLRENPVGSYRELKNAKPIVENPRPEIVWGIQFAVSYTQIATVSGTYTVANRRFHAYNKELRIGINSGTYSSIGPASGLLDVKWEEEDPWVEIKIRGAANALHLPTNNPDIKGQIIVSDIGGLRTLLNSTVVMSGMGDPVYAVDDNPSTSVARRIMGYMALVESNIKVVNATDGRSAGTSIYVFNGAFIRPIRKGFREVSDPIVVDFHADSVIQQDI